MTPPPSDAAEILKLIENVDPSNSKMMDEIDLAVAKYLISDHGAINNIIKGNYIRTSYKQINHDHGWSEVERNEYSTRQYTRSRDALKAIRTKGKISWMHFNQYPEGSKALAEIFHDQGNNPIQSPWLPTEELAELHAIIQSIEYERTQQ